jgi:manganese/iron transport system permease protein/iron/zinc/copper transport system permease protein
MIAVDLLEPYKYEFFRNGLLVAVIAGALCGLLGVFVVLRGMSYIGHGLSHAVFGGAAASAVMKVNYFLGAGIWGIVSGVLIGRISRKRVIGADAAIGVVTTGSFAVGLMLLNRYGQAKRSIEAVLFGSVLGVQTADIVAVTAVAIGVLTIIVLGYRRLLYATFDPEVARISGVRVGAVEVLLMAMLSCTISALLVVPAATTRLMTNSFARMLTIAPIVGALSSFIGMNLAYHWDTSASGTIIAVGVVAFAFVYAVGGIRSRSRIGHLHV